MRKGNSRSADLASNIKGQMDVKSLKGKKKNSINPTVANGVVSSDADFDSFEERLLAERNSVVEEQIEKWDEKAEKAKAELKKMKELMGEIGIRPSGNYVIVKPFETNPFSKMKVLDNGFIVPEFDPHYKSNDTGDIEEMQQFSVFAVVIETSPFNRFVKQGDVVFYNKHESIPIPFYNQGFEAVNETHIKAIIANEAKLEERYKNIKNE